MAMSSEKLHVVERFSRSGPETLQYEITVDDPGTWTKQSAGPFATPPRSGGFALGWIRTNSQVKTHRNAPTAWPLTSLAPNHRLRPRNQSEFKKAIRSCFSCAVIPTANRWL